ncbi:DUF6116 family protein [Lysobacter solisilvae (ex Woo and Kim 2020)]|uniref:Uncharacterized protein n=1 Tax=Agrilutibacter terrestris TaxID=2865112 RepID=A0A7H0FY35_9GAMM|nr:DUF6116 family protein [Lysobacter terrestris]QNP40951.1 hypothetical protein H8B22_01470 [Lysobacter terrestris]
MANPLLLPIIGWARNLRHPTLFKIVAALFLIDLAIPLDDLFPPYFLDELMLGLGTLALASWKKRKEPRDASSERSVIEGESRR